MKKKFLLLISIAAVGGSLVWWVAYKKAAQSKAEPPVAAPFEKHVVASEDRALQLPTQQQKQQEATSQESRAASDTNLDEYARKAIADQAAWPAREKEMEQKWKSQWDTPMNFHGKVVDENESQVSGASVSFDWEDARGVALHQPATSDDSGLFSLTGVHGRSLNVNVSKPGYDASRRLNQTSFLYADLTGRGTFTDNPSTPVLFHLRKKKQAEPLITADFPGFAHFAKLKPDGTPLELDLLKGVQVPTENGQLKLEFWKDSSGKTSRPFDWKLRVSAMGSGLVETTEEFNFEAPISGYQPSIGIEKLATNENWQSEIKSEFYIRLGNGNYGRIEVSVLADNGVFTVRSAINPSGSRNLEPSN